ncbi:hypothetical protein GW17_00026283 [Ensete ventricosum]|nr:hypothetical protein GW17_00026283 [Ensete ventricosum]
MEEDEAEETVPGWRRARRRRRGHGTGGRRGTSRLPWPSDLRRTAALLRLLPPGAGPRSSSPSSLGLSQGFEEKAPSIHKKEPIEPARGSPRSGLIP